MDSYKVRVNPNFRGELILPSIPSNLKGGQLITITEDEFNNSDVRMAIERKYLIDETDMSAIVDADISLEEDEDDIEPIDPVAEAFEEAKEDDVDIDPRKFETPSNPGVWDPDSNSLLDATKGAKKSFDQLSGIEMEVKTGKVIFEDKEGAKKKDRPKGKVKISKKAKTLDAIKKAELELNAAANIRASKTLPIPEVGDIEMVYGNDEADIMFVDKMQEKERLIKRQQETTKKRGIKRPTKNIENTAKKTTKKVAKKRGRPRKTTANNEEID